MILRALTAGDVSGTDTVSLPENPVIGGVAISADGTNSVTVVLRKTNGSGQIIFDMNTKNSLFVGAPIEAAETVHYTVTGTNGTVMLYEFVS